MHQHFAADPDMESLIIDSIICRAHPCTAGASKKNGGAENQALGRSRGGFSTKIHVAVDALGCVDIYVRRVHNSQMGANRRGEDQASD